MSRSASPSALALAVLVVAFCASFAHAQQPQEKLYLDPINLKVPPVGSDPSVKVDYDIVYVRAPRFGDEKASTWTEVSRPHRMDAGADLVLLHPDGSEEVLLLGGKGSVTDPVVSFDGEWVYYALFHDLTDPHARGGGSDLYKVHVKSRKTVRLTEFGFLPNTGVADWSSDYFKQERDKVYAEHALFNLGPCPLPGGKVMFVSNRHAFRPPNSPGNGLPTLQLFVMDDSDEGPGANVECVGHFNLGAALHPTVLTDGRVMFSSLEGQGIRTQLEWGLWSIHPDGSNWNPMLSAFANEGGAVNSFHFQAQLSKGDVVVGEYYVGSNFGMGTLRKFPVGKADDYPKFGPAFRHDPRNPPLRTGRHSNGVGSYVRLPFSPHGIEALTPFTTGSDSPTNPSVRDDENSPRVGKFTHPSGAPDNHALVVWTPGAGHVSRAPQADGGIYLIKDGKPIDEPAEMLLIKNDPAFNEQWPRALVSYERVYGIKKPARLEPVVNDGKRSKHLPEGTPFGLVGSSSLYKRETYPDGVVKGGSVTAIYAGGDDPWSGLDGFTSHGNGMRLNWVNQGADAGLYGNDEIHAVRILLMEPTTDRHLVKFSSHAKERLRVMGEFPVRKFGPDGKQPLDPDGNPDTSFLVKIPADTAFTFQTLNKEGMVLNSAQTWHQVRPGEVRNDCGGCHAHSQRPTPFEKTAAAAADYPVVDLTKSTPLLTTADGAAAAAAETGLRYEPSVKSVEYHRDIAPILARSCAACHTEEGGNQPPEKLVLDPSAPDVERDGRKWPATYYRLALDEAARFGHRPTGWDSWGYYNASRYVRKMQSRRSLLTWKIYGKRTDGWTNDDHPSESEPGKGDLVFKGQPMDRERSRARYDVDFVGSAMPPEKAVAEGKVQPLSDEDRRTITRWIDLGCPIDLDYDPKNPTDRGEGWMCDDQRPTLAVTWPRAGRNQSMERVVVGMHDAYTGIDDATFTVSADFDVDGVKAGENLAGRFKPTGQGVFELKLAEPVQAMRRGTLTVSVKDRQGNVARVERTFSVGSETASGR